MRETIRFGAAVAAMLTVPVSDTSFRPWADSSPTAPSMGLFKRASPTYPQSFGTTDPFSDDYFAAVEAYERAQLDRPTQGFSRSPAFNALPPRPLRPRIARGLSPAWTASLRSYSGR